MALRQTSTNTLYNAEDPPKCPFTIHMRQDTQKRRTEETVACRTQIDVVLLCVRTSCVTHCFCAAYPTWRGHTSRVPSRNAPGGTHASWTAYSDGTRKSWQCRSVASRHGVRVRALVKSCCIVLLGQYWVLRRIIVRMSEVADITAVESKGSDGGV
jgi:hypothetical protein